MSRSNRRWLRRISWPLVIDLALSAALAVGFVTYRHDQHVQCRRINETRAAELKLFQPLLAGPRAPLPADATRQQHEAFDNATKARAQFEANLHRYFDPIDC